MCAVQVRAQDVPRFVEGVAAVSQERRYQMWRLCIVYLETLKNIFGGPAQAQSLAVMKLLAGVASGFATDESAQDVETVFSGLLGEDDLPQFVLEALDKIRANVAAKDRLVLATCEWLPADGPAGYYTSYDFGFDGGSDYDRSDYGLPYGSNNYGDGYY